MITADEVKSKLDERFWSKVIFGKDDECWNWIAGISKYGYGKFKHRKNGKYTDSNAHRYLYEQIFGVLTTEQLVCHKCDNRKCVNPNHMWVGSNEENLKDRDKKGRQAKGSNGGNSKLNEEKVILIKMRLSVGEDAKSIAKSFSVNTCNIYDIRNGFTWNHVVTDDVMPKDKRSKKLTDDYVRLIKMRLMVGESACSLAKTFFISRSVVDAIRNEKIWKHIGV